MDKLAPSQRHRFIHNDRLIYEWDQTVQDINVYIPLPPGVGAKQLDITITSTQLTVGIKGNPPYLNPAESYWTVDDGQLHIQLTKSIQAQSWPAALKGHQLDPAALESERQRLMLERFQAENPGFDFSQAKINGAVPDPDTYLGGPRVLN